MLNRLKNGRVHGAPLRFFFLTLCLVTVILVGTALASFRLHRRDIRLLVGQRNARVARAAATAITAELDARATALTRLAREVTVTGNSEDELTGAEALLPEFEFGRPFVAADGTLLATAVFLPEFEDGLALFAPDGTLLVTSGEVDFWQNELVQRRVAHLLAGDTSNSERGYSETFVHPHTGELTMLAFGRAPSRHTAVGAFSPVRVTRQALVDLLNPSDAASIFIVNEHGDVLHESGHLALHANVSGQHAGVVEAQAGSSGTTYIEVEGPAEKEHIVAYSPVVPVGWALVVEEAWESVMTPGLEMVALLPLTILVPLSVALLVLFIVLRRIVQPLRTLQERATELGWGNFAALEQPVGGIEEIGRLQNELKHMAQKVQTAQTGLRSYLEAVTHGQEEERRRLARELHDDTLQSLIALNQRIQMAQMDANGRTQELRELEEMTLHIIADLRRVTHALRPMYLEDLGLAPALEMLAQDSRRLMEIPIRFEALGASRRLSFEVELALYRMAQEALNNAAHHAQARTISLTLAFTPREARLTIEDDGVGFAVPKSPAEMAPHGHFGLLGLHERAQLIGATLVVDSSPGEGTRIEIHLPIRRKKRPAHRT